jgi:hypothetical protein
MNSKQLLNEILAVISLSKDDKEQLERIHRFLMDEIYEEFESIEIPEKYKKLIAEIADYIGSGINCYVNTDTFEMEWVPEDMIDDPSEYEAMTGETIESLELKHHKWENYMLIEPLESFDSFKIMEGFVNQVPAEDLRMKLTDALNRKKPFANFKNLVDDSAYRQDWFDYRQTRLEEIVYEMLEGDIELNEK